MPERSVLDNLFFHLCYQISHVTQISFVKPDFDLFCFCQVWLFWLLKVSSLSIGSVLTAGLNCDERLVVPEATERVVIKDLYLSSNQLQLLLVKWEWAHHTYAYQVAARHYGQRFVIWHSFIPGDVNGGAAHKRACQSTSKALGKIFITNHGRIISVSTPDSRRCCNKY